MKRIVGQNGDCVALVGEDENPASPTVGRGVVKGVHRFTVHERAEYRALVRAMNDAAAASHAAYFAACKKVDSFIESIEIEV